MAKLQWNIVTMVDDGKSNAEIAEWLKARNVTPEDVIDIIRRFWQKERMRQ